MVWRGEKAVLHHASPVIHKGHVSLTTKAGVLHCLDLKTGEEKYARRLPGPCWATPLAAGEGLYFFGKNGATAVLKAGPRYKSLAVNRLWTADDLSARREEAKKRRENQFPALPAKGKEAMEAMLADAVGDVVYGVAVIDGTFFVRTGNELVRVRKKR